MTMLPFGWLTPIPHILLKFGDTVFGLSVPPVVPLSRSSCPASPSLQWVAWASLPHLPGQPYCTDHRYYVPLRLPDAFLGFVRFSLSSPDTLPAFSFVSPDQ